VVAGLQEGVQAGVVDVEDVRGGADAQGPLGRSFRAERPTGSSPSTGWRFTATHHSPAKSPSGASTISASSHPPWWASTPVARSTAPASQMPGNTSHPAGVAPTGGPLWGSTAADG